MKHYINNIGKEWGGNRHVAFLTPESFTKKIMVVSTIATKDFGGETCVAQVKALNYLEIDLNSLDWERVKKHKTPEEAIEYHVGFVNDCRQTECESTEDGTFKEVQE